MCVVNVVSHHCVIINLASGLGVALPFVLYVASLINYCSEIGRTAKLCALGLWKTFDNVNHYGLYLYTMQKPADVVHFGPRSSQKHPTV